MDPFTHFIETLVKRNGKEFKLVSQTHVLGILETREKKLFHFHYLEEETKKMKKIHSDAWVFSETVYRKGVHMAHQEICCYIQELNGNYSMLSIQTYENNNVYPRFLVKENVLCENFWCIKPDNSLLENSLRQRLKQELKEMVVEMPEFRLYHATGLTKS